MDVHRFDSTRELLNAVGSYLECHEAEHNLMLGLLNRPTPEGPVLLASVNDDEGSVVGVAVRTPPRGIILSRQEQPHECASALVAWLRGVGEEVPGCIGPSAETRVFTELWAGALGTSASLSASQRVFQATRVTPLTPASGLLRRAARDDERLLAHWTHAFSAEADPEAADSDPLAATARRISEETLWVWDVDGSPVSMANSSRETRNGGTIGIVYTPDELRGRGYATACVHSLTAQLLAKKRFVALYADLANPTSTKIYSRIGYQPVGDSSMWTFGE